MNSMRLANDAPKRSGIQNKKTHLMSSITRSFGAPLTSYDS